VKSAALITHSHPPAATEAVAIAVEVAREAGWRLFATSEELDKHGAGAEGIEVAPDAEPDLCLVLGGDGSILHALRRYAHTGVPVFGVNFGTVGFLAAVDRGEAAAGIRRALAGEIETIELPGLEVDAGGSRQIGFNDITLSRRPHDRVAELTYGIAGEEVGHVRCDGLVAATPGRLDRLQPRQPGPDPGLGGEGIRGQLHLAAFAHRAGAGRRSERRPPRRQRLRPRAGRGRGRRRPVRRARCRRRPRGPLRRRRRPARAVAGRQLLRPNSREVRPPRRLRSSDRRISASPPSVARVPSALRSLRP